MLSSLLKVVGVSFLSSLMPLKSVDSSVVHTDLSSDKGINENYDLFENIHGNYDLVNKCFRMKVDGTLPHDIVYNDRFCFEATFDVYTNDYNPVLLYENCNLCSFSPFSVSSSLSYFIVNDGSQRTLFSYNFDSNLYDFTVSSNVFIVFKSEINFDGAYLYGDIDSFFKFFQNDNFSFSFSQKPNLGKVIWSDTFIADNVYDLVTYDNDANWTWIDSESRYLSSITLYKMTQGLFYCRTNNRFYNSIAYGVESAEGKYIDFNNTGNYYRGTVDTIYIGRLYLVNNLDSEQETFSISGDSDDFFLLGTANYKYVDEYGGVLTNSFKWNTTSIICIGDSMPDVEYMVGIDHDYKVSNIIKTINIQNDSIVSNDLIVYPNNFTYVNSDSLLPSSIELIGIGLSKLFGFLNIVILPGVSVGALLLVPFSITIMIFLLKIFKR